MARQLPITEVVKNIVQLTGWKTDSYFIDKMTSSKRYKFWTIDPRDQDLDVINEAFTSAGIKAQARRINKGKFSNLECLGIFVNNEHTNLSKQDLDALRN